MKVSFELQQLSRVTPFILVVDEEANVTWASDAILRRHKKAVGMNVSQLIRFMEPREDCSVNTLSAKLGQWLKLALLDSDSIIPLAGRWFSNGHVFTLLATPETNTPENLNRFAFDDFPESDHLVDLLVARDESARSLAEASSVAEVLKQKSKELEQAKCELDRKLQESNDQRRAIHNMMKDTRQAEKKLRASEDRLRAILDTVHAGIVLIDVETRHIVEMNATAAEMIGAPKEEITGNRCHKFICAAEKGKCPIIDLGQKVDNVERVLVTADDSEMPILKTVALIKMDGKAYLLESFVDLTKQKQAEQELKETHQRLIDASRKAGMTEVATNVLHNVGNVLNSINVSAHFIQDKLLDSKITNLKKITELISEHADDFEAFLTKDERGKHVPIYLTEVTGLIINEQEAIIEKLRSLTRNVEHIKQIIKAQQGYARGGGFEVITTMKEVVEDAVGINHAGLERHGIDVRMDLADLPGIYIDRQRLLQILVNLISNGKYALSESQSEEKILVVRCYKHNEDRLRVEVVDNGVGIMKENISKIFQHGFTTRKDGHGFGLHSSALAAKDIGGTLTVQSEGPGQGAMFILELPLKEFANEPQGGKLLKAT